MQDSLKRKQRRKKTGKKRNYVRSEPYGYQPNNPLTKYYAKYIEKQDQNKKQYIRNNITRMAGTC